MKKLLQQIRSCTLCSEHLPTGTNPILGADKKCKIIIVSQAPGRVTHAGSIPWNDKSGDTLREWMGLDKAGFYSKEMVGFLPISFCFPGSGKTGDLPPRKECAPLWHTKLLRLMPDIELTLLIGQYAQNYYLGDSKKSTLTETVKAFENYLPAYFPLPHPSGRNNIWQAKNPWFKADVLPVLKLMISDIMQGKKTTLTTKL